MFHIHNPIRIHNGMDQERSVQYEVRFEQWSVRHITLVTGWCLSLRLTDPVTVAGAAFCVSYPIPKREPHPESGRVLIWTMN